MDEPKKITVREDDTGTTVVGAGALDLHDSAEFRGRLEQARARDARIAVDLREATYIDTAIIADLAVAGRKTRERGMTLRVVVSKGSHPARALEITGLSGLMDLVEVPVET